MILSGGADGDRRERDAAEKMRVAREGIEGVQQSLFGARTECCDIQQQRNNGKSAIEKKFILGFRYFVLHAACTVHTCAHCSFGHCEIARRVCACVCVRAPMKEAWRMTHVHLVKFGEVVVNHFN